MFEESLVESTALIAQRNRWPTVASIGLQAMAAVALLSLPMLHPEAISLHAPQLTLVAPTIKPPQPPTPPPQRVHMAQSSTNVMSTPLAPATAIQRVFNFHPTSADADPVPAAGTPISMVSANGSGLPFAIGTNTSSPSIAVAKSPTKSAPTRVSSGISAGLLLAPIQPTYPQIAKITHTEGTVVVHAIISKEGKIVSAQVIGGPAMLQGAALEAVRSARYRPYLLNGEPTEVDTTFTVNFRMNS